jgi:transcriptional regulator with XRE-family HTH domain
MPTPARPKLFTAALANLMQEHGVNQVELGERTGIAVSRVNTYLYGNYRTIKPAHVAAMAAAFGGTSGSALVEAHLYDSISPKCRDLIEIKYPGQKTGKWVIPVAGLPQEFAGRWEDFYRLCASSASVRERTSEWLRLMQETKDAKG